MMLSIAVVITICTITVITVTAVTIAAILVILVVIVVTSDIVQLITGNNDSIHSPKRRYHHKIPIGVYQGTLQILNQLIRIPVSPLTVLLGTFQNNPL